VPGPEAAHLNFSYRSIVIRPSTEEDHAAIADIANALYPDRPPRTIERYRAAFRSQPPEASAQTFAAEVGGLVVGHLWLNRLIYVSNPHSWYMELEVHPAAQSRGVGSGMFEFALDRLLEHHAEWVRAYVREDHPVARAFAAHRGFRETGLADRPARLEVRSANTELSQRAAERLRQEGIRIATLEELGETEDVVRRIHALVSKTWADMPASDEFSGISFDAWQRLRVEEGEQPDMVWVAMDGERVVGVAPLVPRPGRSAFNRWTGVARSHRGRGIARALKHHQIEWARQQGVEYLFTENDVSNAPMLRINTDFGYWPLPASLEVVKELVGDG
jgi:GNAT superfamily N-acetyltransferase